MDQGWIRLYGSYIKSRFRRGKFGSSLSDDAWYPEFCELAASDDAVFATFRSEPRYREILEHVGTTLGGRYLQRVYQSTVPESRLREICDTDAVGSPPLHAYPIVGPASPTTLRYLSVLADLHSHFGPLDGWDVLEIGVGYGGQCRVASLIDQPRSWTLVDLPEVILLAQRFLRESGVSTQAEAVSAFDTSGRSSDLLISNYAFSELRREVQEDYYYRFVSVARRGYVTFNSVTPKGFHSISAKAFAQRVGGAVLPEKPRSYPGNKVVVWDHS